MLTPPLRQLAYFSTTRERLSRTATLNILRSSRAYNKSVGVTGALLYSDGYLMQVLEGPPDAVEDVYGRVRQDARHNSVMPLMDIEVEARAFPDWPMGLLRIGEPSHNAQPAVQAVLEAAETSPDRVWSVLRAFRYLAHARRARAAF